MLSDEEYKLLEQIAARLRVMGHPMRLMIVGMLKNCEMSVGVIAFKQKRYEAALSGFDRTLELMPEDANTRVLRTHTLVRLGRAEEAGVEFEVAVALDPSLRRHKRTCKRLRKSGIEVPSCVRESL